MRWTTCLAVLGVVLVVTGFGTGYAQEGEDPLTTQDYIDIELLYARSNQAVDAGDGEAYAATYTEDGEFGGAVGREALVEMVRNVKQAYGPTRHMNMSMVIKGTSPTSATVTSYLVLQNYGVTPAIQAVTGEYEDLVVETPQGWLFKKRTVRTDPPQ